VKRLVNEVAPTNKEVEDEEVTPTVGAGVTSGLGIAAVVDPSSGLLLMGTIMGLFELLSRPP